MTLTSMKRSTASWRSTAVVVDDDAFVLSTIVARLKRMNITAIPFDSVKSAVDYISFNKVGFAIIDLGLPDGNGSEIIEAARGSAVNSDMPVIVITSDKRDAVIMKYLRRGEAIFVSQKPIDWSCLEFVLQGTVAEA